MFQLKVVDQQGALPPSKLCTFKDAKLEAHLNRVVILLTDYDACSKLDDEARRDRFSRDRYQLGHVSSKLSSCLMPLY